jgi:N utilization substance protein B
MATRRQCREWVVQLLFQLDLNPCDDLESVFRDFWGRHGTDVESRGFAEDMVRGTLEKLPQIDGIIADMSEHWDLKRMAVLDRNVIRMALYEMLFRNDIPPVVSINEAVDIAKYFNTTESGRFVNGILDQVRKTLKRNPRRSAGAGPADTVSPQTDANEDSA